MDERMHKKLLIFGIFWLLFSGIFFYTLCASDVVRMNGKTLPAERRQTMILPTGVFFLIGAGLVVYSGKHVFQDWKTDRQGTESYGIIAEITTLAFKINHAAQKKARVLIWTDGGGIMEGSIYIGENDAGYHAADFVGVKYLENHVNILQRVSRDTPPKEIAQALAQAYNTDM